MPSVKKIEHDRNPHFLQAWRKFNKLSQEVAADAIGMSRSNLSKIESGLVPYEQDHLERLARLYGTSPAELLSRDPKEPEISLFDLDVGEKQLVKAYIQGIKATKQQTETPAAPPSRRKAG